jgi:ATPase
VIHATKPIDSIQRFLKVVDMGIIPQVIDTVVFMSKGKIDTIYTLDISVKVPDGMMSDDLARPVVLVRDLDTGKDCYEIYTYGEQLVVQPLGQTKRGKTSPLAQLALGSVRDFFAQELDVEHIVLIHGTTVMLYLRDEHKGRVIGRGGERIQLFERKLGLSISVKDLDQLPIVPAPAQLVDITKNRMVYGFDPQQYANTSIMIYVGNRVDERWIDERGHLVITEKYLIKKIHRDGLMMVE